MSFEDELQTAVEVPCRECGAPCCRSVLNRQWVHADDEVIFRGLERVSDSNYDHPARPDYIDHPQGGDSDSIERAYRPEEAG